MAGTDNKEKNKVVAGEFCHKAADQGAQIIVLPEMWNCPYSNEYFRPFSEPEDGETAQFLGNLAKDLSCYLVGGSFPEIDAEGNVYNTSLSFDPKGQVIAKHRKAHLFDIDIDGSQKLPESSHFFHHPCTANITDFISVLRFLLNFFNLIFRIGQFPFKAFIKFSQNFFPEHIAFFNHIQLGFQMRGKAHIYNLFEIFNHYKIDNCP